MSEACGSSQTRNIAVTQAAAVTTLVLNPLQHKGTPFDSYLGAFTGAKVFRSLCHPGREHSYPYCFLSSFLSVFLSLAAAASIAIDVKYCH